MNYSQFLENFPETYSYKIYFHHFSMLININKTSEIPLVGCIAFGIIDRGTNILQVRPTSVCNLKCQFCSTSANNPDLHPNTFMVDIDYLLEYVNSAVEFKGKDTQIFIDSVGDPMTHPKTIELIEKLSKTKNISKISMVTNGTLITNKVKDLEKAGLNEINISIHSLDEEQAKAILDMRLQKLAGLEQEKIKQEHAELLEKIKRYLDILGSEEIVLKLIREELELVKDKYGDARRSKIIIGEDEDFDMEELIEEETVVVTLSNSGYIKRLPLDTYKTQHRGGKGIRASGMKDEDFIEKIYVSSTHDYLLFFTDRGQLYWLKVYNITEGSRQAKGRHVRNLLQMNQDENITAIIPVRDFKEGYLMMATEKGTIKKTPLMEFSRPRKGGIRSLTLDEDDSLVRVRYTTGENEILLATKYGQANRFNEKHVSAMGRTARGVRGIRLAEGDEVNVIALDYDKKKKLIIQ